MRSQILALLAEGKTYNQIVAELGCAKSTVSYHAKNVREPPSYKIHDWPAVQKFYDGGHGVNECRREFGICAAMWYNARRRGHIVTRLDHRIPLDLLTSSQRSTGRSHLKSRLLSAGVLLPLCTICGLSEWQGKPLSMHLHHVNGVKIDNRLENLQMLCPNCHSQTETYSGKNNKVSNK